MTDSLSSSQFIPLDNTSQGSHVPILYFNSQAPNLAILDCATQRLNAAVSLSDVLQALEYSTASMIKNIGVASRLLISDAMCLINHVQAQYAPG